MVGLKFGDDFLKSSDVLNARGRAGFVLANRPVSAHSCSVRIGKDVHKYAAEQGLSKDEALKKGVEARLKRFVEKHAGLYAKADANAMTRF